MSLSDVVILIAVLACCAAGLFLLQYTVPHRLREEHNDVAGFIFAAVGVTYAVLLAFVVVAVWNDNDSARQTTFNESDELAGVYWISRELPPPLGPRLERESLAYAHTVIDAEWALMADHRSSGTATQTVYTMRQEIASFTPATPGQQVLYDHALTHMDNLASAPTPPSRRGGRRGSGTAVDRTDRRRSSDGGFHLPVRAAQYDVARTDGPHPRRSCGRVADRHQGNGLPVQRCDASETDSLRGVSRPASATTAAVTSTAAAQPGERMFILLEVPEYLMPCQQDVSCPDITRRKHVES